MPQKLLVQLSNRTVTATAGAAAVHRLILPCLKMSSQAESSESCALLREVQQLKRFESNILPFCTDQDLAQEFPEGLE